MNGITFTGIGKPIEGSKLLAILEWGEELDRERTQFLKYKAFLKDCVSGDEGMRGALAEHFPGRFGKKGSQPIQGYSGRNLFGVYQGVKKTADKWVNGK
jgi:hypothetical protein